MATYDLNVIIESNLTEKQAQAERDAIEAQIQRNDGVVTNLDDWGSKRLAYPINKKLDGHYLIYTVELTSSDGPKAIESALRIRDNIMRALIVRHRPEWSTLGKGRKFSRPRTRPDARRPEGRPESRPESRPETRPAATPAPEAAPAPAEAPAPVPEVTASEEATA